MKEEFLVSENTQNSNHGKKMMWAVHSFFILGALISAFLALYYFQVYRPEEYNINVKSINEIWFRYFVLFLTSSILFVCGLRLKLDSKVHVTKILLAIIISLYVADLYLNFKPNHSKSRQFKVVESLRQLGVDAYRDIGGARFIDSNGLEIKKGGRIFPLGGISNKKTVMESTSNSSDLHTIITTDEHGFNNKKGLYNSGDVDIVILGECTLEYAGENDPYEENIGEQLRKLNYKTINLAKQGAQYLQYLAILKEYAKPLKPKVVILSAGGNLGNYVLPPSPLLNKYLTDENFTQNLISRQVEIDNILIEYLYQNWEKRQLPKPLIETLKVTIFRNHIINFVKLLVANLKVSEGSSERSSESYPEDFVAIITMAQQLVSSWGGKLYILNARGLTGGNGYISITDRAGNTFTVNITSSMTLGNVISAITNASSNITASINSSGNGITITDTSSIIKNSLIISEVAGGTTASNLGIYGERDGNIEGADLNATLSTATLISELRRNEYQSESRLENIYADLGIKLMHMGREVFDVHPDPLSLLPNRIDGHPNGEAKRLWAKAIAKRLQADGFMPRDHLP